MTRNAGNWSIALTLGALLIGGCTQEAKQDYSTAGTETASAAKETGKAISADTHAAAEALKSDTSKSDNSLSRMADHAKVALSDDETSGSVKQALITAKDMHTGKLRVDTNGSTVTLSGSVPTADEKTRAGKIANVTLGSKYTVVNQLTVSSGQ